MLGMTGTINALVRDNLTDGSSADEQLEFMQDKCAQAAELLGLHKKRPGRCSPESTSLAARKQQKLLQAEQPRAIECAV